MTISDADNGVASTDFPAPALDTAGIFEGEIEATFQDGSVQTVVDLLKLKVRAAFGMIRASIQRVLLQAISRANGQITAGDVRATQMIATNVHLDSGSLVVGKFRAFTEDPAFADLIQFAVNKALADSAGASELFTAHLFKNVSDVVSMGTVSDTATKDFGKGLIDTPEP